MSKKRVVVTGMSINTPIGDTLDGFLENLLAGNSAITRWKSLETDSIYAKVGGDLGEYDVHGKIQTYKGRIPADMFERLVSMAKKSPFSA
jgi:3-oxoacyl-(acyl-carrier-protein) synthase